MRDCDWLSGQNWTAQLRDAYRDQHPDESPYKNAKRGYTIMHVHWWEAQQPSLVWERRWTRCTEHHLIR